MPVAHIPYFCPKVKRKIRGAARLFAAITATGATGPAVFSDSPGGGTSGFNSLAHWPATPWSSRVTGPRFSGGIAARSSVPKASGAMSSAGWTRLAAAGRRRRVPPERPAPAIARKAQPQSHPATGSWKTGSYRVPTPAEAGACCTTRPRHNHILRQTDNANRPAANSTNGRYRHEARVTPFRPPGL
jgi:hypothetical protein